MKKRELVYQRARYRCEYCQCQQLIVVFMNIDHILPQTHGGSNELENLCLSCPSCNQYKHDFQIAIDPQSQEQTPLFNPRQQTWVEHFQWSSEGTEIVGITAIGRATVERLKMNAPLMVQARQVWVRAGWHPPKDV